MSRIATLQVCDDFAFVGQGKTAYLGLYGPDLVVSQLPTSLPQLYFIVKFRTEVNDRPKQLKFRLELPGETPIIFDHSDQIEQSKFVPAADTRFYQVTMIRRLAPFEVKSAGIVRVFVEDELGEHYAGGLRLKEGILPEQVAPLLANAAGLIAGHFTRIIDAAPSFEEKAAKQLLGVLTNYMRFIGQPPALVAPQAEVRFQTDSQQVHVFFANPIEPVPIVKVTVQDETRATVTHVDELGFSVKFDPVVPVNLAFDFETSAPAENGTGPISKKRKK